MKKYLFLLLFLIPLSTDAALLTKQEACLRPDGYYRDEISVYWPGEAPQVDAFAKVGDKLYYFIHRFRSAKDLEKYRTNKGPFLLTGFLANKASQLVRHDCTRTKVDFLPPIHALSGDRYGVIEWATGSLLAYKWQTAKKQTPCTPDPDALYSLSRGHKIVLPIEKELMPSLPWVCYTRTPFTPLSTESVRFDIEKYQIATKESWFARVSYNFLNQTFTRLR